MTDDRDLAGLDPYERFDAEAARLHRFFTTIDGAVWDRPSRCAGWSVRDVLAHLRADEDYFQACLDGGVREWIAGLGARGATDLESMNALGVSTYAGRALPELIAEWHDLDADTRRRFRERDGGDVDTSVGAYPARWQAFHLAQELATHADDIGVPVDAGEEPARTRWSAAVSRFALKEHDDAIEAEPAGDDTTRVVARGHEVLLADRDFVEAVASRLPDDFPLDPDVRAALAVTP
jgi:uncharacterized protein (TIGR03083 family)